jgi:alkylhydroperoxidase family enzyme
MSPPYSLDAAAFLRRWMPPGAAVEPLALFRTLLRHPELAERMRPLGAALLGHGRLRARDRELAILRTCALCGSEYEWGVHAAAFAAAVGLDDAAVAATLGAADNPAFADEDRAVVALADELHRGGAPSDATWAALQARLDDAQLLELLVVCGFYHLISFVARGAAVPLEPWARRFA